MRCELEDRTPLTREHVAPWLPDADVERIVFGPGSRVIDLGRRARLFRGGARRVVEVRDRWCTFPGCREPVARCDVDHVVEWNAGGTTCPENGRLLCGPHNRRRPGRADDDLGDGDQLGGS